MPKQYKRKPGPKPTGAVFINARISVWEEDLQEFKALPNMALFVRDAIAEKLKREKGCDIED